MGALLLRGRYLVTDPSTLPASGLLEDGAALVDGSEIVETGEWSSMQSRHPGAEVIGSDAHLVVPGFVNAHHHGRGLSAVQLGVPDSVLERWILDFWGMPPLDIYLDTLYSTIRMVRSGVTAVLHSGYPRVAGKLEEETDAALRAYSDIGVRVAYAVGFEDEPRIVFGDQKQFLSSLPKRLATRARALIRKPLATEVDRYFALVESLAGDAADDPRRRILYGPSWHIWCSREFLERIAEESRRMTLGIHMHALESPLEREFADQAYGRDLFSYLGDLELLGPRLSLAHGTWLSDRDIDACSTTGTSVCHNPSSNLRLRNGIAPVARMLERGVNVAVGMDSWGLSGDDDILQEARLAALLHQLPTARRFTPGPNHFDVLRMLTTNGARATGFGEMAGRLLPGSPADAAVLNFDRMTKPYVSPTVHPVEALVMLARSCHVEFVTIGGKVILRDGRLVGIDEDLIETQLAEVARRPDTDAFHELARTLMDLKPHVARHYDSLDTTRSDGRPYYVVNSAV